MSEPTYMTLVVQVPDSGSICLKAAAKASGGDLVGWSDGDLITKAFEMEMGLQGVLALLEEKGLLEEHQAGLAILKEASLNLGGHDGEELDQTH